MAKSVNDNKAKTANRRNVLLSSIVLGFAGVLLFFAQSAYWINHTIFNQESFTKITNQAIMLESSRTAIATAIIDKSLENRPVVKRVAGERMSNFLSGILASDISTQTLRSFTQKAYAYITAPDRQDIAIDLYPIKSTLSGVLSLARQENSQTATTIEQVPDEILLLSKDTFPDASSSIRLMLWVSPLLWLGTALLFVLYFLLDKKQYVHRVYTAGAVIIAIGLFGLFTTPFIPPPLAAAIPTISLRPLAENLTVGFLAPFQTQMYVMIATTCVILAIFSLRAKLVHIVKNLASRIK